MVSAAIAAVAGMIYDGIGAQWLFIIYIAAELVIRMPLLISLPETLTYQVNEEKLRRAEKVICILTRRVGNGKMTVIS